ncbi:MAG: sulfotransferase [Alphaproteobacteria bacterium]|nr:sulfotransferase [Alphaproteobacteria bacterium]
MNTVASEPTGSLAVALAHASRLLERDPTLAEAQAREILKVVPGQTEALLVLASAVRAKGQPQAAVEVLRPAILAHPKSVSLNYGLALALADAGDSRRAIAAFRRVVGLDSKHPHAWRCLGDQLLLAGEASGADSAYARHLQASVSNPALLQAAAALCEQKLAVAEHLLRGYLKEHPTDVAAIRMLAETGARLGRLEDAEKLFARCVQLAPGFVEARHQYAIVLQRHSKAAEALPHVELLLKRDSRSANYRALKAAILGRLGEYEKAVACYQSLLKDFPSQPKAWMSYGHTLKTLGKVDEAIAAYRKSIELMPNLGEAYWSLANLKTYRFTDDQVEAMKAQISRQDIDEDSRAHLHFALGKALEDGGEFNASFAEYQRGNLLRQGGLQYKCEDVDSLVQRSKALFTPEFFHARAKSGCPAADPIFIVGLTRAGSTLIEQMLSSHPAIEGTMELPDLIALAKRFGRRKLGDDATFPNGLAALSPEELQALGEEYLSRTRVQRKLGRPFFIDKMPNNWSNAGFIHVILPNAKIIDARRHPMACCFSNFKQLFARGQGFSYSLGDCAHYYRKYVELMAHFDAVLPGRVHRVIHEQLVENPERELRGLLAYCGLAFEPRCLRFHETERPVRTASSEQVRRPLYSGGLEQWRHFEPWLDELKEALGPVLDAYPAAPAFS